ncbi:hypothetical protein B0I37DRAFT_384426 [Chaetomium sp. MPI-CAGE-AT-0009]|nr:hypothetical protein B0I37DRAFT_384426 [Chaetomium sp. MPI-CAGE-AT-0009]
MKALNPTPATTTILLLLLLLTLTPTASSKCFYPDGSASSDVPCDAAAEVSMCCGSTEMCLSSGLCRNPNTGPNEGISYARGTCTDPEWASDVCPQKCRINPDAATNVSAYDFGTGGVQVWECSGEGYAEPAAYCCESAREQTACCQTQGAVFSLRGASVGNALAVQTFPVSDSETSTAASKTSSRGTTVTETGKTTATSMSETGTASSTPTISVDASSDTGGLSEGTKMGLGIGIGIGIGVAAIISAAILIWYWIRGPRDHVSRSGGSKRCQAERAAIMKESPKELHSDHRVFEIYTAENGPAELYAIGGGWRTRNGPELYGNGENRP